MQLEIARSADTVSGRLAVDDGSTTEFYGWLELIGQLDRATNPVGPIAVDLPADLT